MEPCLQDPDEFPSDEVLAKILGRNAALWKAFLELVESQQASLSVDWKYYRDGKRWLGKVVKKKKTVCWISVWPKLFKVAFYFGSKNDALVAKADIAPRLKEAFLATKGGTFRPVTVEVASRAALKDVRALMALRLGLG